MPSAAEALSPLRVIQFSARIRRAGSNTLFGRNAVPATFQQWRDRVGRRTTCNCRSRPGLRPLRIAARFVIGSPDCFCFLGASTPREFRLAAHSRIGMPARRGGEVPQVPDIAPIRAIQASVMGKPERPPVMRTSSDQQIRSARHELVLVTMKTGLRNAARLRDARVSLASLHGLIAIRHALMR